QPCSARTAGMLAWNSLRIASRMPDLAVIMATTWIIPFPSDDAFENAVMAAGQLRSNLRRPIAKGSRLFPGRALQDVGRIQLVNRQIALHARHRRALHTAARRRAHTAPLQEHRESAGVGKP